MNHYVIGAHGYLMIDYDKANYEPSGIDYVTVPAKMKVAVYIPPGSEFSQSSGIKLQTRILFGGGLADDKDVTTFVDGIRGTLKKRTVQKKNTFYRFDDTLTRDYPRLSVGESETSDLLDYNLAGPQGTEVHGFLWGLTSADRTARSSSTTFTPVSRPR